ncbi:hypothetical protein Tco_1012979, partial [Tanacetum coccineum]
MSTDKESSAAGTDNRPPMLVESDYESWRIHIERYIRGKPLGSLTILLAIRRLVPREYPVVQIVLWYLDSECSRHMTGDRSKLINYVDKFIGTVRFGNDQFTTIVGYGDYKLGNTIITRVYYVEGLSHNLFLVGQFCDGGLEVA